MQMDMQPMTLATTATSAPEFASKHAPASAPASTHPSILPMLRMLAAWVLAASALLQSGCDATADDDPNATFNISTHITGLEGTLVLQQAGVGSFAVTGEGYVELATRIGAGANYNITIGRQPHGQTCTVTNGSGIAGDSMSVVEVNCATALYPLRVSISGLDGSVTLRNGNDTLLATANGTLAFAEPVPHGTAYHVFIDAESPRVSCTVTGGSGTASAEIAAITVTCRSVDALLVEDISITVPSPKTLRIAWSAAAATHYRLLRDGDGVPGGAMVQVGGNTTQRVAFDTFASHLRSNAIYAVEACDATRCVTSAAVQALPQLPQAVGYFRPASPPAYGWFGRDVAMSANGKVMAVRSSGVPVEVYRYTGNSWQIWTQLQPPAPRGSDFGGVVAISADGTWLATGMSMPETGQGEVYLYRVVNDAWVLQQTLVLGGYPHPYFGAAIAFSGDAMRLAVGDFAYDGFRGAVWIYERNESTWSLQRSLAAPNPTHSRWFGRSLALSADGTTLAVGASHDFSSGTGVNAVQTQQTAGIEQVGAVHVYVLQDGDWLAQAYLKPSTAWHYGRFGWSLAMSANGSVLAVGSPGDANGRTGLYKANDLPTGGNVGAVYVFGRSGSAWGQSAYLKPQYIAGDLQYGISVALSADGRALAVGADLESRDAATATAGTTAWSSGAAYLYLRPGTLWQQHRYLKSPRIQNYQVFGSAVALSANADTLAVGAYCDDSAERGINNSLGSDSRIHDCGGSVFLY